MKRKFIALSCSLLLILSLAGCGAAAKSEAAPSFDAKADSMVEAPQAAAPMENYYGGDMHYEMSETENVSDSASGAVTSGQKLIRTARLEMETTEFESTTTALSDLVDRFNGYMENSSIRNSRSGYRYASYTVRIPAERYDEFLNQAGTLCHETWRSTSQEDISEVYYDTAGRLKTQQIKLERLQNLLAQAVSMEDIITIESAISETEMYIDSLSGTLRHYDGKVDYATIEISLNEVYKYSNVEEVPDSFASRLGNSFTRGWQSFVDSIEDFAVSLAYSWMWLVIWGVVIVVGIRLMRRKLRLPRLRRKAEKESDNSDKN